MRGFSIVSINCRSPVVHRMARFSWKSNTAGCLPSATAVRPPSSKTISPPKTKLTVTRSTGGERAISTAGPYTEVISPNPFTD